VDLREGSLLYLAGGGAAGLVPVAVARIDPGDVAEPLFDLTVAGCHTSFVSGMLAHNKNF